MGELVVSAAQARGLMLHALSIRCCKSVTIIDVWVAGRNTSSVRRFRTSTSDQAPCVLSAVGVRIERCRREVWPSYGARMETNST